MALPVYATVAQLKTYLGALEETDGELTLKLSRASRAIDSVLIGAVYSTDEETELPTDSSILEALQYATMEQVDGYLSGAVDEQGTPAYANVAIGSVHLGGRSGSDSDRRPHISPSALNYLVQANLLPISARSYG
ncbi:MAG: hypothetical protein ACRDSF_00110 [Pseudonocardiaceae bacterium]